MNCCLRRILPICLATALLMIDVCTPIDSSGRDMGVQDEEAVNVTGEQVEQGIPVVTDDGRRRNSIIHYETCDSFVFLVDGSGSMLQTHFDRVQLDIVKRLLKTVNAKIPSAEYMAALRLFNHHFNYDDPYQSLSLYPVGSYDRSMMENAIDYISNSLSWAWSSLGYGLEMAGLDMEKMEGHVHIIVFSDGDENSDYTLPVDVVDRLQKDHAGRFCIYTIQISSTDRGRENLEKIIEHADGGSFFRASDLTEEPVMNHFVQEVFGYEGFDDDGDGVINERDSCAKTASGGTVSLDGCEDNTDFDADGVYDSKDRCPATPNGAPVNSEGCWQADPVLFDYNSALIRASDATVLDVLAAVLKKNPQLKLTIHGHTSTEGDGTYNILLSEKRSAAVQKYLEQHGVDVERMTIRAHGETQSAQAEKTEYDKERNRRVEFVVSAP